MAGRFFSAISPAVFRSYPSVGDWVMLVDRSYIQWVRDALRHLYDSAALEQSPLLDRIATQSRGISRVRRLRQELLDAIESLRQGAERPSDCPDARAYRIMDLRYVQGLTPDEAMARLALQKSQFYEDHARAIRLAAQYLASSAAFDFGVANPPPAEAMSRAGLVQQETARLMDLDHLETVELGEVLNELLPVVVPLARERGVALSARVDSAATIERASRILVRQTIIGLICEMMTRCRGGSVTVSVSRDDGHAGVHVAGVAACDSEAVLDIQDELMATWRQAMLALGGAIELQRLSPCEVTAHLAWQAMAAKTRTLLVIDDNQEFASLYSRYLVGHGWVVVGATNASDALLVASQNPPTAIVLDLLMPHQDGWEVLMTLKKHPRTAAVPVVVCSVLDAGDLARSLGAEACLTKPVDEEALLDALDAMH